MQIGAEKVVAGAAAGVTTPVTGPLGAAGAAYGAISGTGQVVQGATELTGAITGHTKEAESASDALSAPTTIGGVIGTVASKGNVETGAKWSAVSNWEPAPSNAKSSQML